MPFCEVEEMLAFMTQSFVAEIKRRTCKPSESKMLRVFSLDVLIAWS